MEVEEGRVDSPAAAPAAREDSINRIILAMVVIACVLICAVLTIANLQSEKYDRVDDSGARAPAGWAAVVGAAIVFGTTPPLF
jgi:uncharacterized membrane protein